MKFSQLLPYLAATQAISAASIPEESKHALLTLEGHRVVPASDIVSPDHTLERRKGGGGRGGGGGGSRTSSGGNSGSRGGGGGSVPARAQPNSAAGGRTSAGSGAPRIFGGGNYYGGGAREPYRAGSKTPKGLLAGALIAPAAMLLIMPGLWWASTYPYHYNNHYRFYNETATNDTDTDNNDNNNDNNNNKRSLLFWTRQSDSQQPTGVNQSLPVMCVCQEESPCGCDENDDPAYLDELVGNGSYPALNKSLVTVSEVNGTTTLVLNGTLPGGTTAPGGTDDETSGAMLRFGKFAGYYALGLMVVCGVVL